VRCAGGSAQQPSPMSFLPPHAGSELLPARLADNPVIGRATATLRQQRAIKFRYL
jgi:hypothetical protein